ncbi:hypothetical protein TIFTF001_027333 [Ficus carica]|uniref:Uncharacterized protein n=1 Tax=Ficus carica TaxID=3494 RepID=A0AA88IYA9_FICCA|nr:hypothetical protein TIFTF001_027333 [Ficus carica]
MTLLEGVRHSSIYRCFPRVPKPQVILMGGAPKGPGRLTRVECTDVQCPVGWCHESHYLGNEGEQVQISTRAKVGTGEGRMLLALVRLVQTATVWSPWAWGGICAVWYGGSWSDSSTPTPELVFSSLLLGGWI